MRLPVTPLNQHGPVVQRQRLLAHIQDNDGSIPSGTTSKAQVRQLAERLGLNPSVCGFDSRPGHSKTRLGRQSADHLGLEPGMLWVRVPPEPLEYILSSWSSLECSPPCHGGDRGFKSRRGRWSEMARYANW